MKTLIVLIAGAAFWLAGYYCGQKPNSPDVFGWTAKQIEHARQAGGDQVASDAMRAARQEAKALLSREDTGAQTATAAPSELKEPAAARTEKPHQPEKAKPAAIPECW